MSKKTTSKFLILILIVVLLFFYNTIFSKGYNGADAGTAASSSSTSTATTAADFGDGGTTIGGGPVCGDGICSGEDCSSCPTDCCVCNVGTSCNCGACGCGGTIQCSGACSGPDPTPPGYGLTCNCGACGCGGTMTCSGSCSGADPTPINFGQSCNCGLCGCGGTILCSGACSGPNPTPINYGKSCGSCGGTILCSGACSVSTPQNYGASCGNCGTIGCTGNCVNQGVCSPGAVETQTQDCGGGGCGTQSRTRTCTGSCSWGVWSGWSSCTLKPGNACFTLETQSQGCNTDTTCSGSQSRTCSSCQWGSWGSCSGGTNCNSLDGWYGGGNTQTATCGSTDNDASSEFRNYGCSAGSCTFGVTQTQDCDSSDGWYGGGNNAGCGTDPNSVWNDYYVITNTNSCTSTTTCTGTGTVNCDSQDVCNNKCEGTVFTSVPPMKDYFVISNSNSCTSTVDSPVNEDCSTKPSTDSDGSATAFTLPGTVTDYTSCTLSGCGSTSYSDSCLGTTLTEYGASGSSFTSSQLDCQNYETNYCSNDRYFRQEWGCGATPAYCHNDFAADTAIGTNADGDLKDLQCGDSLCDNAAGVFDSTKTATETNCVDGLDNDCDGTKDCADSNCAGQNGPLGVLCCQTAANCVQDDCKIESCTGNTCSYSNRNACEAAECSAGTYCDAAGGDCKGPDESSNVCLSCVADQTPGYVWNWAIKTFEDAGKAHGAELFNSNNAACTQLSGGPCFDNTGKPINHRNGLTTGNCCGDDANEFYKLDYYGAECVSSLNDCVWSTGDSQSSDSGNVAWWCYLGKWDDCTAALHLGKHHGSVVCAGAGTGWTLNPLPENQYGPNACTDGLDNDGDTLIDCNDPDCVGSVTGTVKNQNDQGISSADVNAKKDLTTVNSAVTNQQGSYTISSLSCGSYNLVASHADYAPQTKSISIQPSQQITADFSLVLGTSCEQDCTFAAGEIIYAACEGKNGCAFYDSIAKAACDYSQPGWARDYNSTHYITCASGSPQPKIEIESSVSCASGTLVKVTRIVVYSGKPVKLVVATCG